MTTTRNKAGIETGQIGGHYPVDIQTAMKQLALDENTTIQTLLGQKIIELLKEKKVSKIKTLENQMLKYLNQIKRNK